MSSKVDLKALITLSCKHRILGERDMRNRLLSFAPNVPSACNPLPTIAFPNSGRAMHAMQWLPRQVCYSEWKESQARLERGSWLSIHRERPKRDKRRDQLRFRDIQKREREEEVKWETRRRVSPTRELSYLCTYLLLGQRKEGKAAQGRLGSQRAGGLWTTGLCQTTSEWASCRVWIGEEEECRRE